MARMARLVIPGYPHHVTQRGNRRQKTFFAEQDYSNYVDLLSKAKAGASVQVWAYCLMPNHVHLVVVPTNQDSLSKFFGEAHRRYTTQINRREDWRGHLWQERFHSSVMDEKHLLAATRYVELNPVRAGLCRNAIDWRWSSVHAHRRGSDDPLVTVQPMLDLAGDWDSYLNLPEDQNLNDDIRTHSRTGRPLGSDQFVSQLERVTGRQLKPGKPGPPSSRDK